MDEAEYEQSAAEGMNFVPCIAWVPRGQMQRVPDQIKLNDEELRAVVGEADCADSTGNDDDDDDDEEEEANNEAQIQEINEVEDFDKRYDLVSYDADQRGGEAKSFALKDLVSVDDTGYDNTFDDSDQEDLEIKPTDNVIVVGHVEHDAAGLDVYVYNNSSDDESTLYVHHDIPLASFPLAVEFLRLSSSSLVAVGLMKPTIQVWDLDVVNVLKPAMKLGKVKDGKRMGHTDAVLSLAWNEQMDHVMASGSVDKSVCLWDLWDVSQVHTTFRSGKRGHQDRVQSLRWRPSEAHTLLTSCADGFARTLDGRSGTVANKWNCSAPTELAIWDRSDVNQFYASTESGHVHCFDVRQPGPVWRLHVGDPTDSATDYSVNDMTVVRSNLLSTVCSDGCLRIYDVSQITGSGSPQLVVERDMQMGRLHCVAASPETDDESKFVVCIGGDRGSNNFCVHDVRNLCQIGR